MLRFGGRGSKVKIAVERAPATMQNAPMAKDGPTREERLAQRLRDNLKRRKAQARERESRPGDLPNDGAAR